MLELTHEAVGLTGRSSKYPMSDVPQSEFVRAERVQKGPYDSVLVFDALSPSGGRLFRCLQ